jgi:GDPmannose 4,6-dehydratase
MSKTALITGVTGQDGPYLAKLLLSKGYRVYGLVRRYSSPNFENLKFLGIDKEVELLTGDLLDDANLNHVIKSIRPNELYNLAAQSFVGISWDLSKFTTEVNAIGTLNLLNAVRAYSPETKFYQASTSEMFGNGSEAQQNEATPFHPRSPYGVSKLYAHCITRNFRESFSLFACSGILFNHESPLRGREFVTRKVSVGVAKIALGIEKKLCLGNLNARRDWGFAGDYVEAMWQMLQQEAADDFVIATGQQHSVGQLLERAFRCVGISDWESFVETDPRFKRPAELHSLQGDYSKARATFGWEPRTSFGDLVDMMVEADLKRLK